MPILEFLIRWFQAHPADQLSEAVHLAQVEVNEEWIRIYNAGIPISEPPNAKRD